MNIVKTIVTARESETLGKAVATELQALPPKDGEEEVLKKANKYNGAVVDKDETS